MKHQSNDVDLETLPSTDALTRSDDTHKDVPVHDGNIRVPRIELLAPRDAFHILDEHGSRQADIDGAEQTGPKRRRISESVKSESDLGHQLRSESETAVASIGGIGSGQDLESGEEDNAAGVHSSSDSELEFGEIPPEPMPLPMEEDGVADSGLLLAGKARALPSSSNYSDPARRNSGFGRHTDSPIVSRPNVRARTKDTSSSRAGAESSGGATSSIANNSTNKTMASEQRAGPQGVVRPLSSLYTHPSPSAETVWLATPSATASTSIVSRSPRASSDASSKSQFAVSSLPPKRPHLPKAPVPERNDISRTAANRIPNVRPPATPVATNNRPQHQTADSPVSGQPNLALPNRREVGATTNTTATTQVSVSGMKAVPPVHNTIRPVSPLPPRPVPVHSNNATAGKVATSPVGPSVAHAVNPPTRPPAVRPMTPASQGKQTQLPFQSKPPTSNVPQTQPARPVMRPVPPASAKSPPTPVTAPKSAVIRPMTPATLARPIQRPVVNRPPVPSTLQTQPVSSPIQLVSPSSATVSSAPAPVSMPQAAAVRQTMPVVQTNQNRPPPALDSLKIRPAHSAVRSFSPASTKMPSVSTPILKPAQLPSAHNEPNQSSSTRDIVMNEGADVDADASQSHSDTLRAYAVGLSKSADRIAAILQVLGLFESKGFNPSGSFDVTAFNRDAKRAAAIARSLFGSSGSGGGSNTNSS